MNKVILEFIKSFEENFSSVLNKVHKQNDGNTYTDYFIIYTNKPKEKYSDWDIECWVNPENISKEKIIEIDEFIREYKDFKYVGHLLSFSDEYKSEQWHHIDTAPYIAFMGSISNSSENPFFDIHLNGQLNNEIIREIYANKTDEELKNWLMLTAWRKIKNCQKKEDVDWFLNYFIIPGFPEYKEEILQDPILFFKKQFHKQGGYDDAILFLNN